MMRRMEIVAFVRNFTFFLQKSAVIKMIVFSTALILNKKLNRLIF